MWGLDVVHLNNQEKLGPVEVIRGGRELNFAYILYTFLSHWNKPQRLFTTTQSLAEKFGNSHENGLNISDFFVCLFLLLFAQWICRTHQELVSEHSIGDELITL